MKMIKKMSGLLLALSLFHGMTVPASAEGQTGLTQWRVTFDGKRMAANYTAADFADSFSNIQPGDVVSIEITLHNDCGEKADWYIQNNILDIFEEAEASNGAYTYQLTYTQPGASAPSLILYDSRSVGGDNKTNGEGLNQINPSLGSDYLFLDSLENGEEARVTLTMGLDGETMLNAYQEKSAALSLYFAAEIAETPVTVTETQTTTVVNRVVRNIIAPLTQDGNSLVLIGALAAGAAVILAALAWVKKHRKEKEEQ